MKTLIIIFLTAIVSISSTVVIQETRPVLPKIIEVEYVRIARGEDLQDKLRVWNKQGWHIQGITETARGEIYTVVLVKY